jgi:cyanophycin synthetase
MNQVNVHNVDVFVDYCHNAPGMRVLGDFVEAYSAQKAGQAELGKISRLGVIATAGDRRDDDMRELGAIAAQHFDVLVVREDERLRGRRRGECAELVAEGARAQVGQEGVRCRQVEIVLDEVEALHHVMARANPGDVVVLCVDKHAQVLAELEGLTMSAQAGAHTGGSVVSDPDLDPVELQSEAQVAGEQAGAEADEEVEAGQPQA